MHFTAAIHSPQEVCQSLIGGARAMCCSCSMRAVWILEQCASYMGLHLPI